MKKILTKEKKVLRQVVKVNQKYLFVNLFIHSYHVLNSFVCFVRSFVVC